jgi:hypothetical protein
MLERLLKHAKMISDGELTLDFKDCLLPVARSDRDREILLDYLDTRSKGPKFQARNFEHNNHAQCGWDAREPGLLGTADQRVCVSCGTPLDVLAREDVQTCSPKCRRRLARRIAA